MWINLFTITLAIAFVLGAAALIAQYDVLRAGDPKHRRTAQRRFSRVRG